MTTFRGLSNKGYMASMGFIQNVRKVAELNGKCQLLVIPQQCTTFATQKG
jgi:hypothetical protein